MPTQFNVPAKQVDRPEVSETYGDTIRAVWFDGTWRLEIDVTRLDASKGGAESMTATQVPSCRLVLSAAAGRRRRLGRAARDRCSREQQPAQPSFS